MAKGYLAKHNVSFEVKLVNELNETSIQQQNPHLTNEQANEVLEILTNMREIEKRNEGRFSETEH